MVSARIDGLGTKTDAETLTLLCIGYAAEAKFNYQLAAALQNGGLDGQLSAMNACWGAGFWCDLARAIAKKVVALG